MVALPTDPDKLIELYRLGRGAVWRYQLDQIETAILEKAIRAIESAIPDVLSRIEVTKGPWTKERLAFIENELRNLSKGIQGMLTDEILNIASTAGAESALWHSKTLSIEGIIPVSMVSITPDQFKAFFETTPLGGKLLSEWVEGAFERSVIESLEKEFASGILQGKSYPKIIDSIEGYMGDFTRRDALNLARTYVQSANVAAQDSVINANSDIIDEWEWCATMETSYMSSGNGTCLECAALDGNRYKIGAGPPIPLHINCRCYPLAVTKTWKELGIDLPELDPVERYWREFEDMPIGEGGRTAKDLLDYGRHTGDYGSWFDTRSETFQKNALGPKRYELYKDGKVSFKDFIDQKTGRLKLINEL